MPFSLQLFNTYRLLKIKRVIAGVLQRDMYVLTCLLTYLLVEQKLTEEEEFSAVVFAKVDCDELEVGVPSVMYDH